MNLIRQITFTSFFGLLIVFGVYEQDKLLQPPPAVVLKVIAGSELKDIEPMLRTITEKTGVQLKINYVGTLDGAETLFTNREHYDLAWFSHAKYLTLLQANQKIIQDQEKIALSPVIPAIKESLAKQWGWVDNPNVTWLDLAEKIKTKQLNYAMADPTASNSGFSTVMSVQAALANKGDALAAQDVDAEKLKSFFKGQALTAGSSGFLSESYLRDQARVGGIFNYESELLKLNQNPQLKEKLVLIYPKEGVVTADYPLILLDKAQSENYRKVVDYLKSIEFQTWMANQTERHSINPAVAKGQPFANSYLMELPFPHDINTVNEILFAYLNDHRKPSHAYFVLDVSGSMSGERIADLKRALDNLAGDDTSLTGKFAQFRPREIISIIPFNNYVNPSQTFNIDKQDPNLNAIKTYVSTLKAKGGTAIFTALEEAYTQAEADIAAEPESIYSIVLMTDGINEHGIGYNEFAEFYQQHARGISDIRTFPIVFGEANSTEMQDVATLTGGKMFDSRKSALTQVFKQIRGYQ